MNSWYEVTTVTTTTTDATDCIESKPEDIIIRQGLPLHFLFHHPCMPKKCSNDLCDDTYGNFADYTVSRIFLYKNCLL